MVEKDNSSPMKEAEVRSRINEWSGKGMFRLKNMGDKIFIDKITRGSAYSIHLQTQYEDRKVKEVMEPFHGGSVDNRGRPPSPWEIQVSQPRGFEDRTEKVPIPHTEKIKSCPQCGEVGKVTCATCAGQGRMRCPLCQGLGYRETQVPETSRDAQGNSVMTFRTVRKGCTCAGGMVRCSTCSGNGRITCPTCQGSGRVKTYDLMLVRFQAATKGHVIDITPVPDDWFIHLGGGTLVDEKAPELSQISQVSPDVDGRVREMLAASHEFDEKDTRILQQHLQIKEVPIHEVKYRYAGHEFIMWICGNERKIHAPKAPWLRGRFFFMLFGIILAASLLIALLLGLFLK